MRKGKDLDPYRTSLTNGSGSGKPKKNMRILRIRIPNTASNKKIHENSPLQRKRILSASGERSPLSNLAMLKGMRTMMESQSRRT